MLTVRPPPKGDALLSGLAPPPARGFFHYCGLAARAVSLDDGRLRSYPSPTGEALVRGRNVPEKSRLRCSDLCRLCVCRILVLVLGPRNSSRGGKLLTAKAPARSEAARAFFAVTPATAVPTPPRLRSESSMGMTDATAGFIAGLGSAAAQGGYIDA
jgi:hypothetical protein